MMAPACYMWTELQLWYSSVITRILGRFPLMPVWVYVFVYVAFYISMWIWTTYWKWLRPVLINMIRNNCYVCSNSAGYRCSEISQSFSWFLRMRWNICLAFFFYETGGACPYWNFIKKNKYLNFSSNVLLFFFSQGWSMKVKKTENGTMFSSKLMSSCN